MKDIFAIIGFFVVCKTTVKLYNKHIKKHLTDHIEDLIREAK